MPLAAEATIAVVLGLVAVGPARLGEQIGIGQLDLVVGMSRLAMSAGLADGHRK